MKKLQKKQAGLRRRHTRVRGKISGTAERPRLCITRSNANMYAQVIDDVAGKTICAISTLGPDFKKSARLAIVSRAGKSHSRPRRQLLSDGAREQARSSQEQARLVNKNSTRIVPELEERVV